MIFNRCPRATLAGLAALAVSLPAASLAQQPASALTQVIEAPHQMTGVAVSEDGRVFVNFPRWTEDAPVSVAEVLGGQLKPYPDAEWNAWRNARKNEVTPGDHWVCVQSVVADGRGNLWVLDPAAPATGFTVPDGPKLVRIDLKTNKVAQTILIPESVAPRYSYLNDVRFSPDGGWAFISDSGANGALVVVGLQSGKSRRLLDGHPVMQPEPKVVVTYEGAPIRRPDGRGVEFANDSIALSNDGRTLYFKPLTGKTLYSIATDALTDENASADAVAAAVRQEGDVGVTDGIWISRAGTLFLTSPEDDSVKVRDGGAVRTLLTDDRLRWPDTFSEGPDGAIYVTASRIQDMNWYKPGNPDALTTQLWKFDPAALRPAD
jgi:sugar lactone lactonase YvrE